MAANTFRFGALYLSTWLRKYAHHVRAFSGAFRTEPPAKTVAGRLSQG